jgi:hypothetical protein
MAVLHEVQEHLPVLLLFRAAGIVLRTRCGVRSQGPFEKMTPRLVRDIRGYAGCS